MHARTCSAAAATTCSGKKAVTCEALERRAAHAKAKQLKAEARRTA